MVVTTRVTLRRAAPPIAVFLLATAASSAQAQEQGRGSVRHSGADYSVHVDNRNPLPNGLDRTGTQSTAGAADNRNEFDRTRQDNRNDIDRTQQDNRNNLPDGLDPVGRQSVPGAADNRNQITRERADNRTDHRGDEMYELDTARGAAPRGHHYVRPGTRVGALPRSYIPLNVGGGTFYFYNGVYYQDAGGGGYSVVPAPAGAEIMMLPVGSVVTAVDHAPFYYYYYYGAFYIWHQERTTYTVAASPVGATVTQLPDGYTTTIVSGVKYYEFGGIRYRPYSKNGTVVYTVVG